MNNIFANHALKFFENGYNILPIEPFSKSVKIPNWQVFCDNKQTQYQIEDWIEKYPMHNIGMPLGAANGIIALDFDNDIDGLHIKVQELIEGSLIKKRGLKGFTAFYKYNGEVTKRWRKDGKAVVELLSTGTQTVLPPSIHPDSKQPYQWLTYETFENTTFDNLTYLPHDFINKVDKLFGYDHVAVDFNKAFSGETPPIGEIEKALSFIPSNDYATWIEVGMALKEAYGDAAYNTWDAWSRKASNYNAKGMPYKWGSFGNYKGNSVKLGTIFHHAKGYGYIIKYDNDLVEGADFKIIWNGRDICTGEIIDDVKVSNSIHLQESASSQLEFPQHLLDNAPGLPGEIAAWINSTSLMRQPILALGAAICAAGTLFAHRIRNDSNLRTNFMILGLAESGSGKNHAAECIRSLFHALNLEHLTIGKAASDTGLINRLHDNNCVGISLMDEIGREIQSLASRGAGSHESRIMTLLMEIYSQAGTYYDGKCYANAENSKKLIQPHLNLYGTSVPKRFFDSMSSDESVDGFLARWLIFQSHDIDPPMQQRGNIDNIPISLLDNIKYIQKMPVYGNPIYTGHNITIEQIPNPTVIEYTEGAIEILRQFSESCNTNRLSQIKKGGLLAPIWARTREHAIKLALVAHPYKDGVIETITMKWACEMATFLAQVAIKAIEENVADSEHEKLLIKVYNIIKRWCDRNVDEYMPDRSLRKNVKFISSRDLNNLLTQMVDNGMIEIKEVANNTKISYTYRAV